MKLGENTEKLVYMFTIIYEVATSFSLPIYILLCSSFGQALKLTFSGLTGRLKTMFNKHSNITVAVDQNLLWWRAKSGNFSVQPSGAYIFSPDGILPHTISPLSLVNTSIVNVSLLLIVTAGIHVCAEGVMQLVSCPNKRIYLVENIYPLEVGLPLEFG